jgi:hypothetical protein
MTAQGTLERVGTGPTSAGGCGTPDDDLFHFLFPGQSFDELRERVSRLLGHVVPGPADLTVELMLRYTAAFTVRAVLDLAPRPVDAHDEVPPVATDQVDGFVATLADALRLLLGPSPLALAPAAWDAAHHGAQEPVDGTELVTVFASAIHSLRLAAGELLELDQLLGEPLPERATA